MNPSRLGRALAAPSLFALALAAVAPAFAQAPPPPPPPAYGPPPNYAAPRPAYGPQPYGPQPMFAGPQDRPHFYWGGHLGGFFIAKQVTDQAGYMGQGGGGGLHAGFRFSHMFALELNASVTYHNEQLGTFGGGTVIALDNLFLLATTVDAKIYFGVKQSRLQPYAQVGVGYGYLGATYTEGYCASFNCDTTFAQGPMFQIGGGFDYWLTPRLTLGSRLLYRGIRFSEANYGDVTIRTNSQNFINGLALDFTIALHY